MRLARAGVVMAFGALVGWMPAAAAGEKAPLVEFADEGESCASSETLYLTSEGGAPKCEGAEYSGPLSETQYDAVLQFARTIGTNRKRSRERIVGYARAAVAGENAAEFDEDAGRTEIEATLSNLFTDVGATPRGELYLNGDFYFEVDKSKQQVVRALVGLVEGGRELRTMAADQFRKRPPGDYGPIGIFVGEIVLSEPPASATVTFQIHNLRDPLRVDACSVVPSDSGVANIYEPSCAIEMVFSDGNWRVSRAGFEALFGITPASLPTTSTTAIAS